MGADRYTFPVEFDFPEQFEGWELFGSDGTEDGIFLRVDYGYVLDDNLDPDEGEDEWTDHISVQLIAYDSTEYRYTGRFWLDVTYREESTSSTYHLKDEQEFDNPYEAVEELMNTLQDQQTLISKSKRIRQSNKN